MIAPVVFSKTRMVCSASGRASRAQPGVEGRLPAAGLGRWKFDVHPGAVQHMNHCLADVWEEGVDQAGDEKLDGFGHNLSGKLYFTFVLKVTQLTRLLV